MFESDDFDQVLSQYDFPGVDNAKPQEAVITSLEPDYIPSTNESKTFAPTMNHESSVSRDAGHSDIKKLISPSKPSELKQIKSHNVNEKLNEPRQIRTPLLDVKYGNQKRTSRQVDNFVSPKHLKRKIINSHFNQQSKRKFPGPAGLLTGVLEEAKDESIGQIEFLSQDMDFTENNLRRDLFESPLWKRLVSDTREWNVHNVDSIKEIKQQALAGNLRKRKARTVTAFIEAVDRSVTDPLIILRDETGSIQCTLHRDAWSTFSPYLVSECCALVLQKPTVLTTGGAFKKHYLNITLSNILAIYSSAVMQEERVLPNGYAIVYEEDYTVIRTEICSESIEITIDASKGTEDLFDGLDNLFSDEVF